MPSGKERLIIYADRTSVEVFADDGLTYIPLPINLDPRETGLEARAAGGPTQVDSLEVYELSSIWPTAGGR